MKTYLETTLKGSAGEEELMIGLLSQFQEIESFEESKGAVKFYVQQDKWANIKSDVQSILSNFQWKMESKILPPKNWNEEWEKNFQPIAIGHILNVRAPFHPVNDAIPNEIILDPRNAFGTGHHETTAMMLEEMSSLTWNNNSCLDLGTGTGILSIWAHKLGCRNIMAIDNTMESVENAKHNLAVNNIPTSSVEVKLGAVDTIIHNQYDVVLANINRNVLIEYADNIIGMVASDGHLLLSGILQSDLELVTRHYERMSLANRLLKGEWSMLHFKFMSL